MQNSDGDFNHLPVQCLCEFLLSNATTLSDGTENQRDIELLAYLQKLLMDDSGEPQATVEVLEYFLRRLSSTSKQSRQMRVFENREEDAANAPPVANDAIFHVGAIDCHCSVACRLSD